MLAMAIFPLWWSSFSETLGRRTIYIVSFTLFLLFNILSAVSINTSMLIVMRILGGGAAASVQAVGAGTIADLWVAQEKGNAMGYFYLGPLMGPLIGPLIGGVLGEKLGWRSTQWFLAIYGAIILVFIVFALPETLQRRNSTVAKAETESPQAENIRPALHRVGSARSVQQKSVKLVKVLSRIFVDPLKILYYLRFPAVLITIYYASITFGSLYVLNISLQSTFAKPPYDFSVILVGVTYIPGAAGYLISSLFAGRWTDIIMIREAKKAGRYDVDGRPLYQPEDRMRENAWIAAVMYPSALLWYGWSAEKGVHPAVPVRIPNPLR